MGFTPKGITLAPNSQRICGAHLYADPLAQSTTIFKFLKFKFFGKLFLTASVYLPNTSSILFTRPTNEGPTRSILSNSNLSISFSTRSDNLKPSGPKNLIPLSSKLLCDAEIITPRSALIDLVNIPTAGVGIGPKRNTSIPIDVKPDVRAVSNI